MSQAERHPPPEPALPTLWLLGKTGAGKTTVVHALTGEGVVGDGIVPTTRGVHMHRFPEPQPIIRFLDTRGLGEVGYDPAQDCARAQSLAQAVLVVVRLDDAQIDMLEPVLRGVRLPVLTVFTGGDLVADAALRAVTQRHVMAQIRAWTGGDPAHVDVALPPDGMVQGVDRLLDALDDLLPACSAQLRRLDEARSFARARPLVMRYAGMASGADVVPLLGAAAVPAAQAALLQALAKHHGVTLTSARLGVLASALGVGALARLGATHLARQGAKLVPGVGQTLGAAVAAGASFATTYALGRAASAWMHGLARGRPTDAASLRALYDQSLRSGPSA